MSAFIGTLGALLWSAGGYAISYQTNRVKFDVGGYGTVGIFEPNFEQPEFLGDFRLRTQLAYNITHYNTLGAVFMIDEDAVYEGDYWHEMFAFWHMKNIGRLEIGFTNSVAHKLGLGLPDVGGLRINHDSLLFRKIGLNSPVIADPEITNGSDTPRINIVSATHSNVQYGISVAGLGSDYDYEVDAGLKLKLSQAKMKYALSVGASFMSHPDDFSTDDFVPKTTADWRAQFYTGLNLQYNSWVFATTVRMIYDENPLNGVSDGIVVGSGLSYDILNYTVSATYMFSDVGVWHDGAKDYIQHTGIASFRYKYSRYVDGWTSVGMTKSDPFVSAGIRITF